MIFQMIGRLILSQLLGSPEVKKKVFEGLKAQAAKSDTKIDDDAVKIVEEVWDVIIPVVSKKF